MLNGDRRYYLVAFEAWQDHQAVVTALTEYILTQTPYYLAVEPIAAIWRPTMVPPAETARRRTDKHYYYLSSGALSAALESELQLPHPTANCTLAELPHGLEFICGPQSEREAYLGRGQHDAAGSSLIESVHIPPVPEHVSRQPLPPEQYSRFELILTIIQDAALIAVAIVVRAGTLWLFRVLAPPEEGWALRALEFILQFGIVGTAAIHVAFDLSKRVVNAVRHFRRRP